MIEETTSRLIRRPDPAVGLVIGTFAAVPYVHLNLEARQRFYPYVPVLVHDDSSPNASEIKRLCDYYRADFISLPSRMQPCVGDMSCYVEGLHWADRLGLDLLVKMSRRFLPICNWVPAFQRLAWETSAPTYSNECQHFNFGFRTECVGFHVPTWLRSPGFLKLRAHVEQNQPAFVEGLVHNIARDIDHTSRCQHYARYLADNPRPSHADAYAVWSLMPPRRTERSDAFLWHDSDTHVDYARVARLWRLPYAVADFADPNQGYGSNPD